MDDEERPWSWEDDIPDGTSWEDILWHLRWIAGQSTTRAVGYFGLLEFTATNPIEGEGQREQLLRIAMEGKESLRAVRTYMEKINEYRRRMKEKAEKDKE